MHGLCGPKASLLIPRAGGMSEASSLETDANKLQTDDGSGVEKTMHTLCEAQDQATPLGGTSQLRIRRRASKSIMFNYTS
jgi:hypothetical protein